MHSTQAVGSSPSSSVTKQQNQPKMPVPESVEKLKALSIKIWEALPPQANNHCRNEELDVILGNIGVIHRCEEAQELFSYGCSWGNLQRMNEIYSVLAGYFPNFKNNPACIGIKPKSREELPPIKLEPGTLLEQAHRLPPYYAASSSPVANKSAPAVGFASLQAKDRILDSLMDALLPMHIVWTEDFPGKVKAIFKDCLDGYLSKEFQNRMVGGDAEARPGRFGWRSIDREQMKTILDFMIVNRLIAAYRQDEQSASYQHFYAYKVWLHPDMAAMLTTEMERNPELCLQPGPAKTEIPSSTLPASTGHFRNTAQSGYSMF
ncbi:MAG: hypothetical protein LLG04_15705 [Parachlamydia sp.]|nr:hypothetical protein [Parachlamydia sp.]